MVIMRELVRKPAKVGDLERREAQKRKKVFVTRRRRGGQLKLDIVMVIVRNLLGNRRAASRTQVRGKVET